MNIFATSLDGVWIVEPDLFKDSRGYFMETYQQERYYTVGIDRAFVQDNLSCSVLGALRGLHYQLNHPQAKLVQVIKGAVFDVAVDIRVGSPTFGKWTGIELSDVNRRQLFVAEGFAHGFSVLSETAYFVYKCSNVYVPEDEGGILWSDPEIGINWRIEEPLLSSKDASYPPLSEIPLDGLPIYKG